MLQNSDQLITRTRIKTTPSYDCFYEDSDDSLADSDYEPSSKTKNCNFLENYFEYNSSSTSEAEMVITE